MKVLLTSIQLLLLASVVQAAPLYAEATGHDSAGGWANIAMWFWIGVLFYYFVLPFFRDK